jgi:hypothetical protein
MVRAVIAKKKQKISDIEQAVNENKTKPYCIMHFLTFVFNENHQTL